MSDDRKDHAPRRFYVVGYHRRSGVMHLADEDAIKTMRGGDIYGRTICGREMDFAASYPLDHMRLPWQLCARCEKKR